MAAPRAHAKQLTHTEAGVRAALAERYRANADSTGKAHDMKAGVVHILTSKSGLECDLAVNATPTAGVSPGPNSPNPYHPRRLPP